VTTAVTLTNDKLGLNVTIYNSSGRAISRNQSGAEGLPSHGGSAPIFHRSDAIRRIVLPVSSFPRLPCTV
jgi:hypothetical protein